MWGLIERYWIYISSLLWLIGIAMSTRGVENALTIGLIIVVLGNNIYLILEIFINEDKAFILEHKRLIFFSILFNSLAFFSGFYMLVYAFGGLLLLVVGMNIFLDNSGKPFVKRIKDHFDREL